MSHFTVMVIGDDFENALAPFHEFECTGIDDEYVVDVDRTAEYLQMWEERTELRFKDPDGGLHDPSDDEFFVDPPEGEKLYGNGWSGGVLHISKDWGDGQGYRAKIRQMPDGWEEVKINTREHQTFQEWVRAYTELPVLRNPPNKGEVPEEAKYGYLLEDKAGNIEKVIRRTNQNAKWDWYQVGGRWSGMLSLKLGGEADQARKGDVDWDTMRDDAETRAAREYDAIRAVVGCASWTPWRTLLEEHGKEDVQAARDKYNSQLAIQLMRNPPEGANTGVPPQEYRELVRWGDLDRFLVSRETYLQRARDCACVTFAVLMDGKWYERGEMGWWGCVANKKEVDVWNAEFAKLMDSLDDDEMITIVDCHI